MKEQIKIVLLVVSLLAVSRPTWAQDSCIYWQSRVDPNVQLPKDFQMPDEKDAQSIVKGTECLLSMQGNKKPAAFSGATRLDTSQFFKPAKIEVAALFYISYLYYRDWGAFSGGVALRGKDGELSSEETVNKAYTYYREWFKEIEKIGIVKARELKISPLKNKDVRWY
jgi:hypothetical protein